VGGAKWGRMSWKSFDLGSKLIAFDLRGLVQWSALNILVAAASAIIIFNGPNVFALNAMPYFWHLRKSQWRWETANC